MSIYDFIDYDWTIDDFIIVEDSPSEDIVVKEPELIGPVQM